MILCILPLLPALTGAVLRVAPVGRRERKQARTWGWLASAIRTVGQRLAQSFPSILLQSDKGSGVHLPCLSVRASASCLISVLYPGEEGLSSTHRPLSEPQPLSALSPVTLLPLLLPGVALGCVLAGGHKLSRSLAIPARSALGLSQPGLHWREVPVAVHLQRGPLAVHFQDVHPGVAAWNQSSDVVCPTGSAWQLPGPVAL